MPFNAILDASVLVPAALRDTLLRAAESYLYRPLWSDQILAETEQALRNVVGVHPIGAKRIVDTIREVFPEALVSGYQNIEHAMTVDEGDRHVAAAAVVGGAQVIVTLNLRHFPQTALDPYNIEVLSPDEFLEGLFDLDGHRMVEIILEQSQALQNPIHTPLEVCNALSIFVPRFASLVMDQLS